MTDCPECGLPAEILDRFVAPSTSGPVEVIHIRCPQGHWFTCPTEAVERARTA